MRVARCGVQGHARHLAHPWYLCTGRGLLCCSWLPTSLRVGMQAWAMGRPQTCERSGTSACGGFRRKRQCAGAPSMHVRADNLRRRSSSAVAVSGGGVVPCQHMCMWSRATAFDTIVLRTLLSGTPHMLWLLCLCLQCCFSVARSVVRKCPFWLKAKQAR